MALYRTSREIIDVTNKPAGVLRVVEMAGRGRAVVAAEKIRRDQLVERAPVLVVEEEERPVIDTSSIGAHIFMWEHGSVGDDLYSGKGRAAVVLGLASLVNHSATPMNTGPNTLETGKHESTCLQTLWRTRSGRVC